MYNRLLQWRASVPPLDQTSQFAPPDIFAGSFNNTVALLYFPSPLLPTSTAQDIDILAKHAAGSIEVYKTAFRTGRLRFYWRTVHNLFRGGMAVIYCIRSGATDPRDLRGLLHSCAAILWGMVERYPPGKAYRDVFDSVMSVLDTSPDSILDLISVGLDGELPPSVMDSVSWADAIRSQVCCVMVGLRELQSRVVSPLQIKPGFHSTVRLVVYGALINRLS